MKIRQLIFSTILIVFLLFTLISPVLIGATATTWRYSADFTVTNSNATAYTNLPLFTGFNSSTLISTGYLNSNGTNLSIGGGSDFTTNTLFMTKDDDIGILISSLPASTTQTYRMFFDYFPNQTQLPILTGYTGGYITVADDASLELSNDFQMEYNGTLNLPYSAANMNLFYKQAAFRVYLTAGNKIRVAVLGGGDAETLSVDGAITDTDYSLSARAYNSAMDFNNDGINDINDRVPIELCIAASSYNVFYDLNRDSAVTVADVTVFELWLLTANYSHSLVIYANSVNTGNPEMGIQDFDSRYDLNNDGIVNENDNVVIGWWIINGGGAYRADYDINNDDVINIGDETALAIWYLANGWSIAMGAVTVPDNANDIIINKTNILPSLQRYELGIASTAEIFYIPQKIISGTTLPNLLTGHNGTITWGTNPAGITISLVPVSNQANLASSGAIKPASMPNNWFAPGTTPNFLTAELRQDFTSAASEMGMTEQTLYIMMILAISSAVIFGIILFTGSIMLGIAGGGMIMALGVNMGLVSGWMVFLFILLTIGIYYITHQHG